MAASARRVSNTRPTRASERNGEAKRMQASMGYASGVHGNDGFRVAPKSGL
jgi:hypothetical protein